MENIKIPPFFIGQEVVAVESHSQGAFKKGDEFRVTSIKKGCCNDWDITIGILPRHPFGVCLNCGYVFVAGREWVFDSKYFTSKYNYGEFISLKQVAEEAFEVQGVN